MKNLDFKITGISVDVDKLFTIGVTILWKLLISTLVFYLVGKLSSATWTSTTTSLSSPKGPRPSQPW